MSIRFFEEKDYKWIKKCVLSDKNMRLRLGIKGGPSEDNFKNDSWNAAFVIGDNFGFSYVSFYSYGLKACIRDLYIVKGKRRNGLGKKLLKHSIDYARECWGGNWIYALTIENKPMEKLLKKLNFKKIGTFKKWMYRNRKYYDQSCFKLEY